MIIILLLERFGCLSEKSCFLNFDAQQSTNTAKIESQSTFGTFEYRIHFAQILLTCILYKESLALAKTC